MSGQISNQAAAAAAVPPESAPLTQDDQQFLEKLEKEFANDMPIQPQMLIRFVRGYANEKTRWETTVQKLKETLEWRKANNVDNILQAPLDNEAKYFEMWPHDFHGFSKSGHPVYYESSCASDPSKLLEAFSVEDQQKFHIQMMETLNLIKLKREKETGLRTYKAIVVMDLSGLSRQHMGSQFTGPIKAQINIDQYYYPESLQTLLLINAPFVFRMLWSMIKPWLHPLTAARIQILGSDYIKQLQEVIDMDQIPRYHGGSCNCCTPNKSLTELASDKYEKFVKLRKDLLEECNHQS